MDTAIKFPLVLIRWLDSCDLPGWKRLSEWGGVNTLECVSVGFLVAEDEKSKTVAPHLAYPSDEANTQGAGIMVIPARSILELTTLTSSSPAHVSEDRFSDHQECGQPSAARLSA